jgi:hypothetical protein
MQARYSIAQLPCTETMGQVQELQPVTTGLAQPFICHERSRRGHRLADRFTVKRSMIFLLRQVSTSRISERISDQPSRCH